MAKQWIFQDSNPKLQKELSDSLKISPIVAQVLINRGITNDDLAAQFLEPTEDNLHDPFLYKGMTEAVQRIKKASAKGETVLIYGDYDVDGVTSTTFLHGILKKLNIDALTYLPHRFKEGYGLTLSIVDHAKKHNVGLLITVDCGITAVREVAAINAAGIDVLIFDHHEPGADGLPLAYAIVDPKQPDCNYPFDQLATVGLMAKLSQAVFGKVDADYLDLVAMGTIADMVPLVGENRILVKLGLPLISQTKHKGLMALLEKTKIKGKKIAPYHIGFVLGPRINAAGRMDSAHRSLDLFLSQDAAEARVLAQTLDDLNQDRQRMQKDVLDEAMRIVDEAGVSDDLKVIVLSKVGWHKGVLGIVASRIKEKYYRPAIVISVDDQGMGTASCRSIDGFNLHEALSTCSDHLEEFGGHAAAAGLTIKQENIDSFTTKINSVSGVLLTEEKLVPTLGIDCEINLVDISMSLINVINGMEPYGQGNPMPIFCARKLTLHSAPQALGRNTLKFWVTDGHVIISVIGFGMADQAGSLSKGCSLDVAFELAIDDWNKAATPQLMLKDFKVN